MTRPMKMLSGLFGAVAAAALLISTQPNSAQQAEPALPAASDIQAVSEADGFSFRDEAAFRDAVRAYLLDQPEVLMEAMKVLEQRRMVEEIETERQMVQTHGGALFDDGFSYVGGNPEGSVTVVEFQDYRCGYCKRAHGDVQELVQSDGDIRLIIKEFPILGPDSITTSKLAIATMISQGPEAYKRISDAMMTFDGPINDAALDRLARSADIDIDAARALMDDPEVTRRITATHELGRGLAISGTPTFVVGEKMVRGYLPLEEMRRVVALTRTSQ